MILRYFIRDKIVFGLTIFGLLADLLAWLILFWQVPFKASSFFLHYTVYFGVDWVGEWRMIFLIPLAGLLFLMINVLLAYLFYKSQKLVSYLFLSATVILEIFIIFQSIFLVVMNV